MNKINGYTEDEAKSLVDYIWEGRQAGKTLTWLFASYGARHGRARGSVRNYYYSLMKKADTDKRVVKLLDGKELTVEKIREFTEEETDKALRSILAEKSKGISVRRAIANLAKGDDKLMLRLQNKYRNILKKDPGRIRSLAEEMGFAGLSPVASGEAGKVSAASDAENAETTAKAKKADGFDRAVLQRRLENEINLLYDRLTKTLKDQNARLLSENQRLSADNLRLRRENDALKRRASFREV